MSMVSWRHWPKYGISKERWSAWLARRPRRRRCAPRLELLESASTSPRALAAPEIHGREVVADVDEQAALADAMPESAEDDPRDVEVAREVGAVQRPALPKTRRAKSRGS
jgi:hypothetical protein